MWQSANLFWHSGTSGCYRSSGKLNAASGFWALALLGASFLSMKLSALSLCLSLGVS